MAYVGHHHRWRIEGSFGPMGGAPVWLFVKCRTCGVETGLDPEEMQTKRELRELAAFVAK